jgi:hypothetical protein
MSTSAEQPRQVGGDDLVPLEELIRRTPGAHPISSVDELRSGAFETDEEQLSEHPDRVVRHEPSCCAGCEHSLAAAREAGVIRRQVTEIPPVRAEVTGHQLIGRRCNCGRVTWGEAPDGVTAPVQYGPRAAALGAYLALRERLPASRWRPR